MFSRQSSILTSAVITSRYIPVWIALVLLVLVALMIAPATLSSASFSAVLPLTSVLAIAALGQMLVIMTGGIDLSSRRSNEFEPTGRAAQRDGGPSAGQ